MYFTYLCGMDVVFRVIMNEKLFLRDPEQSVLGKKIVKHGLELINKIGFEEFTFKKLAVVIDTTEASIYRYFENKHKLLVYLFAWYWSYLDQKLIFVVNNITDPELKLKKILNLLAAPTTLSVSHDFISEGEVHRLIMLEGSKAYLTRHVSEDNKDRLFKPYKDLCARFSAVILEYNPKYKFSHSLASTLLEMSHSQKFFMENLPALTDFGQQKDDKKLLKFLESLLFGALDSR